MTRRAVGSPRFGSTVLALVAVAALVGSSACSRGEDPAAPRRHLIEIGAFEYLPDSVTLAPGDTVVWVNGDLVPHTATATDGTWDSGSIAPGGTWTLVVPASGDGGYTCTFHPTMIGRLEIE